ncbi:phosphomannomutase/phosphoglucomutase [Candidatus Peregrinibacteria bacterium]|nr:phosphomannomutase/phosphoglucomutase [Candidatus Peregrinibacteria bacterium]
MRETSNIDKHSKVDQTTIQKSTITRKMKNDIGKHPKASQTTMIDLTPEVANLLGKGIGTYMQKHYGKRIAVGHDNRLTSENLHAAFIKGLMSTGCNVTSINLATSPLLYYTVCKYDFDGGINITASHNPKEYNGFKIVGRKGHSICGEEIQTIRVLIDEKKFARGQGSLEHKNIFDDYMADMKKKIQPVKPLKIVIDAGNGTAGAFAPKLFRSFGHEIIPLYCELDGNFPNHPANPEEHENMIDLIKMVKKTKADLGIGFDGDGDRIGMVDEKGQFYAADFLLILLSRDLLSRNKGAKIVYDLKSSQVLEKDIYKNGGVPIMAKTGHSFIEQTMKREEALLGGEVSGHMFFGENYYGFDDAFLAGLKLAEILSKSILKSGKKLSEQFQGLPKTCITPEIKAPCGDAEKCNVVEKIKTHFERDHKCITIDGVRVDFGDNAWGIVRCSNTSPYLTLRFEAKNTKKLNEIQKKVFDALKIFPEVDNSWYPVIL